MNENVKEILLILQEECAEVSQSIAKCFRFGPDQCKPGKDLTNIQHLEQEIGDLLAMIELLVDENVGVTDHGINEAKLKKFEKLKHWSNLEINK